VVPEGAPLLLEAPLPVGEPLLLEEPLLLDEPLPVEEPLLLEEPPLWPLEPLPEWCRAVSRGIEYSLPAGEPGLTGGGEAAEATGASDIASSIPSPTSLASSIPHLYHTAQLADKGQRAWSKALRGSLTAALIDGSRGLSASARR